MSFIDVVRYRLRALLRSGAYARELDDELQHHLELEEMEARSTADTPLSHDEARRRARRQFGNVTYSSEERRMISGIALFDAARQDVHFVLRLLRRRAGFAAVTITTIALGIGAATSIFSVADAVLFRPLPLPDASRLIAVWMVRPQFKSIPGLASRWDRGVISLQVFRDWRTAQTSFEDVAIWSDESRMAGDGDKQEEIRIVRASASLLPVLGVKPLFGTPFTEHDDAIGGAPVALVSYETWAARFGSDPHAVGRVVQIDTTRFTIIGVLPPGLTLERNGTPPDYWLPAGRDAKDWVDRDIYQFRALGRLKRSVSLSAATAESDRIFSMSSGDARVKGTRLATLHDDQTRIVRRPLLILLAASGLLLLIACINVATLLLGESARREDELRTRTALGAGRGRLVRQLLTESVVLAGAGAACGVALALAGTKLIVRLAPPSIPGLSDVHVDARILAVALIVAGATGLLFGLAPAMSLTRSSDPSGGGVRLGVHNARGRRRGQRALIACEVALSMVLLVAAGLLVRSFDKMLNVGFRPSQLVVLHLHIPPSESSDSVRFRALYRDVVGRLRSIPNVLSASATSIAPFSEGASTGSFEVEGHPVAPGSPAPTAHRRVTTPEFFATAGIPIVAGRSYSDADRSDAPLVVVVNRTLARSEWPTETAVGKRIKASGQWRTVVGVAGDILASRPSPDAAEEVIYVPLTQLSRGALPSLIVRTRDDAAGAVAGLRSAIHDVAPEVSVTRADEMDALISASLADDRLRTVLIALFGVIAVLLATVGTYGVAATEASRRTREMAIRVAIGATSRSIARLVVGGAAAGVAVGALVGVGLALAGARVLSPYLYGVGIVDPIAYGGVVALLAVATVAATWLPARRATRVPLVETLRAE
jgi:predicted permease